MLKGANRQDGVLTDEYVTLVRGALAFIKVGAVDLLVVGLPVKDGATDGGSGCVSSFPYK